VFKLISLTASGFKRLDLNEKLVFPDGCLLIHGRNESGKSTLMEAIHYALYGMPLRPSRNAGNDDLIQYGRDNAVIELKFSIDDAIYQVRREIYKKKTNTHRLNKRGPDGKIIKIARGARKVNEEINEILHGVDSDALLNSCLVEQKELGKLEASSRQERIKAMSSLLNLEAFIDSREKLKKERGELERAHFETLTRLREAEKAKEEYEEAEKRLIWAEKRLQEIESEKKQVSKQLEQLEKTLGLIQQIKTHQLNIKDAETRLTGKMNELEILQKQLADIEKKEQELKEIEDKIPEAEEKHNQLMKKSEALKRISSLSEKLSSIESSLETLNIRYDEKRRAYDEASEALKKVTELEEKIKEYGPARIALEKLETLSDHFSKMASSMAKIESLEADLKEVKSRINASKTSAEALRVLEERENQIKNTQAYLKKSRSRVLMGAVVGALIVFALGYLGNILWASIFGVAAVALGAYLYASNDPDKLESLLNDVRAQRESLLGEQARLREYHESVSLLEKRLEEEKDVQRMVHEALIDVLNQLPDQPREYRATVSLQDPETLNQLRVQVQKDYKALASYTAEKRSLQGKADELESIKASLESMERDRDRITAESEAIRGEIAEVEEETGVTLDMESEIEEQRREAYETLTRLKTRRSECIRALETRPRLHENISKIEREIDLIKAERDEEKEKLEALIKKGVNPDDEPRLIDERDRCLRNSASLENEGQERLNDVSEARETMERSAELWEQYPGLLDQKEREAFQIEAMQRAMKLLDTTREAIMASVKQSVEKNMMRFLPPLTDNRYNRARIDETNYRIEVYDREAKQWRGKGVFSGATQDQFSLALRLAFAISTIPATRGARPGFIFLDEPLSSFDTQRRTGFLKLLKEDLSHHFSQIIVISHIESLIGEFQNTLTLDQGRVVQQ